jgi:hypothetical protein
MHRAPGNKLQIHLGGSANICKKPILTLPFQQGNREALQKGF